MIRFLLINNKKENIMKILSKILVALIIVFSMSTVSYAHSGGTDSSGGHNCSAKSQFFRRKLGKCLDGSKLNSKVDKK